MLNIFVGQQMADILAKLGGFMCCLQKSEERFLAVGMAEIDPCVVAKDLVLLWPRFAKVARGSLEAMQYSKAEPARIGAWSHGLEEKNPILGRAIVVDFEV